MNAEELSWKIFTNGAVGLLDNIKAFEQSIEQRTRKAIRDTLLDVELVTISPEHAAEIAMTTEIGEKHDR